MAYQRAYEWGLEHSALGLEQIDRSAAIMWLSDMQTDGDFHLPTDSFKKCWKPRPRTIA